MSKERKGNLSSGEEEQEGEVDPLEFAQSCDSLGGSSRDLRRRLSSSNRLVLDRLDPASSLG